MTQRKNPQPKALAKVFPGLEEEALEMGTRHEYPEKGEDDFARTARSIGFSSMETYKLERIYKARLKKGQ